MRTLFSTLFLAFVFLTSIAQAQNLKKEWAFVHKEDGRTRQFKQGQKITVKWRGLGGLITSKGNLVGISKDSLVLDIDHLNANIAKKDIEQIALKRKVNFGQEIFIYTLIAIGVVIALFSFLFCVMLSSLGSRDRGKTERIIFIGLGVLTLGLINFFAASREQKILKPIFENWTLQEIPAKTIKTP